MADFENLRKWLGVREDRQLAEEDDGIWEMSTLMPHRTRLSRPIWVDDLGVDRSIPHSPYRIKVQARRGEPFHTRTNSVSIYFDKAEPYIAAKDRGKHDLNGRELKEISNFIKKHRDLLELFYARKEEEHDAAWLIFEIEKRKPHIGQSGNYYLIVAGEKHRYSTRESKMSAKCYWKRQGVPVVDPVALVKRRKSTGGRVK